MDLTDASEALAFSATSSGRPRWATPVDFASPHCNASTLDGLDAAAGSWSVACASEPASVVGPTRLGSQRYWALQAVDVGSLQVAATVVNAGLAESAAAVELKSDGATSSRARSRPQHPC